jgi:hypothetical protein
MLQPPEHGNAQVSRVRLRRFAELRRTRQLDATGARLKPRARG